MSSIPPDVTTLTLSEDGTRVAWKQSEGYWKSELTIEEYVGDKMKVLRKISVDGYIPGKCSLFFLSVTWKWKSGITSEQYYNAFNTAVKKYFPDAPQPHLVKVVVHKRP